MSSAAYKSSNIGAFAILFLILLLAPDSSSWAAIISTEVDPPNPTALDTIRVSVEGYYPDGCCQYIGHECQPLDDHQITIDIDGTDGWHPGLACPAVVVLYEFVCQYDPLPAGDYTVILTERNESLRWPDPQVVELEIHIDPAAPTDIMSWGRIRALYR